MEHVWKSSYMNLHITKSNTMTKNTIDQQYTEQEQL